MLLVLGGGPVGVEMAQAVRRLGSEVALVEGGEHVLPREPAPLGEALGEALRRDGVELAARRRRPTPRAATARTTSSSSTTAASCAATGCSSPPGRRPRVEGIGLETVGVEADRPRIAVDAQLACRRAPVGDRRRRPASRPLTHVGKYQGEVVAANILGEAARGSTTRRCRASLFHRIPVYRRRRSAQPEAR